MAGRIIDERTGERCDYAALAKEAAEIAREHSLPWRSAAEIVAQRANPDQWESIVRNLDRKPYRPAPVTEPIAGMGALPGICGFLPAMEARAKEIRETFRRKQDEASVGAAWPIFHARQIEILSNLVKARRRASRAGNPASAKADMARALGFDIGEREIESYMDAEADAVSALLALIRDIETEIKAHPLYSVMSRLDT